MIIGDRLSVGYEKSWRVGVCFAIRTVWIDFFGFYLNYYWGRKI